MTRGSYEDEEFERLQRQFGDRLDRGDHTEFGGLDKAILGGRGRPGRAVPPVASFADWPDAADAANRVLGDENPQRRTTLPEVRNLVLLTVANAVVAVAAVTTGATAAGLLSCSALSVGTIGLTVAYVIRSSRRP